MGTRNLTVVVLGGEYKVAQYGQWDGYPEGQGATVLGFLRSLTPAKKKNFIKKVKAIREITPEEGKKTWVDCGADPNSDLVSMDIADKHTKLYPQLSRDTGAKILDLIAEKDEGIGLHNQLSFAADSLFCEFAYVIDLDKDTFEIYRGFNQSPLDKKERFADLEKIVGKEALKANMNEKYTPIRLLTKFNIKKLPTKKAFLSTCEKLLNKEEK